MYKSEVHGKGCISAKVVAHSISPEDIEITTFELEYPRFIHAELMTHRLFSRNAMSSRAVPIEKMIEQVRFRPAMPIEWGKNQKGMQAKELFDDPVNIHNCEFLWIMAAKQAAEQAEKLRKFDLHKQIINRILEPFQVMKAVLTATEFDNFFYLRCHGDAQPEIKELADCMYQAKLRSIPELLKNTEWHTPYVRHVRDFNGELLYTISEDELVEDGDLFEVETALKISSSCCAQVSYRLLDNSVEKAEMVYDRLVESKPVHASPFEHQAKPVLIMDSVWDLFDEDGVTHIDENFTQWSGNLRGWIQYRQTINGHVCWDYEESE